MSRLQDELVSMATLKQKVVRGSLWSLLERFGRLFVGFGVTLILARLLTPADYGVVALLTIFIAISGSLVDAGFGDALVQKKDASELDFNSVFYLSLALSFAFYLILFFVAPFISRFYAQPILVPILRILALTLVFNSINSVQNAELKRNLLFDRSFKISLIELSTSAMIGVVLAFLGYGPWAIVWSQIGGGLVGVVSRWFIIAWRPKLMFSWTSVRALFHFGWKVTCVSLINKTYINLYGLLIGKLYTPADLALVNKGKNLPSILMSAVDGTINSVAFPAMAQLQDQMDKVRLGMRKMLLCSTFLVFPLMIGLAVCAPSVVFLLFGERWLPCVPYVQIACFGFAVYPFHTINLFTLLALGHSDVFLKVEIIKKIVGVILMVVSIRYSVMVFMLVTTVVFDPFSVLVNTRPVKKIIGYPLTNQLHDIAPALVGSLLMGCVVYGFGFVSPYVHAVVPLHFLAVLISLMIQVILGVIVYGSFTWLFKLNALGEYWKILSPRFSKLFPRFSLKCNSWLLEK